MDEMKTTKCTCIRKQEIYFRERSKQRKYKIANIAVYYDGNLRGSKGAIEISRFTCLIHVHLFG